MAFALTVDIIDPDGSIKVEHVFFGETEEEARTYLDHHLATCDYFKAAEREGRTIEDLEEIADDERPVPPEDELEAEGEEEDQENVEL